MTVIEQVLEKVLYGEFREELKGILRQLLDMKKIDIVEESISKDLNHLSVRIPPKTSVSRIMGILKRESVMMLND